MMRKIRPIIVSSFVAVALVACNQPTEEVDQEVEQIEPEKLNDEVEDEEPEPEESEQPVEEEKEEEEKKEGDEGIGHHHDLPYEWSGSFEFKEGTYTLELPKNEFGDESMLIAFILENSNITDLEHHAAHILEADVDDVSQSSAFEAMSEYGYNLILNSNGSSSFTFTIATSGIYKIFTEHVAEEFDLSIVNEASEVVQVENPQEYEGHGHSHGHDHDHDHDEDE
ncbi:hypothetical protein [Alkalihalobacillus sp. LMS39]|uniref:hypothetical protein n=1 Tax=Alkalihalobacillus sp. LMS39 TaxID=2924032 RepID=UPI001FB3B99E|nr:hypothetical protein [Alkalihalobacillus sp. LMS39]UOE92479.1 hypothetical protein MM271_14655 [Alkalihalobacillus sp. LMS39]